MSQIVALPAGAALAGALDSAARFCKAYATVERTSPPMGSTWQNVGNLDGRAWGLLALVVLVAAGGSCTTEAPAPRPRPVVRIATAFGPLSDRLIEEYRRLLPAYDIRSHAADTLEAIELGAADLGITTAKRAYSAYWNPTGSGPEDGNRIRGVSLLQPLSAYVLVRPGSNIWRVADLTGRVVGLGPRNSSSWTLGTLLFEAAGVQPKAVRSLNTRAAGAAALKDGSADAIFLPGYIYPDESTYSMIRDGAYLIPIEGPAVDRLRRSHPFVRATTIPRNIYPGQDRVIPTIGLDMIVVCRRDLDESVVRDLTQQLFNALPRLAGVEASLRFLDIERGPATPLPLHPGASRYFRERELSR